ncbi:hypothetical protein J6E39_10000 [bacterium]|nr:hypothetical protein [bacterium]
MILPVRQNLNINFSANGQEQQKDPQKLKYSHDTLLKNNLLTRTRIGIDKLSNAFTLYPAKGLKGSENSNFYEFLTMGTVPYLVGSGMLMGVFNFANKHYESFSKSRASKLGNKFALGVLFYGLAKSISRSFVSKPVKALTGVDVELPYAKVIYELPENVNDTDITSIEYHKVFESVEFPRFDLLYGDEAKGEKRNKYYDKIAAKLGIGKDLTDSDQEVKPIIRDIVVKTTTAQNLSQYFWAACGVGYAFQKPWETAFNNGTLKFWKKEEFMRTLNNIKNAAKESWHDFYKGTSEPGISKYSGKLLLGAAALSTIAGVVNAVTTIDKPSKLDAGDVIDSSKKYVVN